MNRQNLIGFDTRFGYRTVELMCGDLTEPEAQADLVVVSAFAGGYTPTPGTVFGAFKDAWGLDLRNAERELDLRGAFSLWISRPLARGHFKRILCVELVGSRVDTREALANVFVGLAIMEAKGMGPATVAMPVLGAGLQQVDPQLVMSVIVPAARQTLETASRISRILFVDRDQERITALSEAANEVLGRVNVSLPKSQLIAHLRADVVSAVNTAEPLVPPGHRQLFDEMRRSLSSESARSFEVGTLARRLVEFVVDSLLNRPNTSPDLAKKIDQTASLRVANWIRGYMHTLRYLGNESVHEKDTEGRVPPSVNEEDLVVCLFCMQRVLSFWLQHRSQVTAPSI